MYKYRSYQEEAHKAIMKVLEKPSGTGVVVIPTGGGKSIIAGRVPHELKSPIIVLQPSKELLVQNYRKLVECGGEASVYCASLKEKTIDGEDYFSFEGQLKRCKEISQITYATIGSIKKEIKTLKKMGVKVLLVDEAHIGSRKDSQLRKFKKELGIKHVIGMTATPIYLENSMEGAKLKMMNRIFNPMFRNIIHVTQIKELVEHNFWSKLTYKVLVQDESKLELNSNGSDYSEHSLNKYYQENDLEGHIQEEVQNLRRSGRKKILVFVPSIQQGEDLAKLIPGAKMVHGKTKSATRKRIIDDFSYRDSDVLINVGVLLTGYDNPSVDAIINARPTASMAIYYQLIGRGVRIHPKGRDCIITDFSNSVKNFGKVEDLHFEDLKGYGWGMFNGKNEILTDFPIQVSPKPTKKSVTDKAQQEVDDFLENANDPEVFFGKHKGKKVSELYNDDKDKGYLFWLVKEDFLKDWGTKGEVLKAAIYKKLRIPLK